ncbi:MAG: sialidase family protein [Minicystis sp.]
MKRLPRAPILIALAAGCAGTPPPPPRVTPPTTTDNATAIVSPARWDYHPAAPSTALTATKVDAGGCVFTAEGGQRWSAATTKMAGSRLVCAGKAEVSSAVAVEDLSSAIRRDDGSWIFVSTSGMLFEAADALGPFTRTVPAPEPLARVTGAGAGVLATTLDGRLLRWEVASGWKPAVTSGPLTSARVFDVVVGDGGHALALGFPEALYKSEDGGATWSATGAPTVGARQLGRTASGDLGAQGLFETLVWKPRATPPFARGTEKISAQQAVLDIEVERAAAAPAVQAGRAVVDGDRYYEIIRPDNEGEIWQLARGRIEGRLETLTLPDSRGCGNVRLGARGKTVYVVCVSQDRGEIAAEVRRSTDAGSTWGEGLKLVTPDTDQINVAVAPDGGALITGLCRPSDGAGTCKPGAPMRIKMIDAGDAGPDASAGDAGASDAGSITAASGPGLRAVPASAPQLSGAALLPTFSIDGRSAYFLGRRGKDDRVNLFVSHDGGDTFSPRALDSSTGSKPPPRPREDDEEPAEPEGPDTFEVDETSSLRVGEDGSLGMLLLRTRRGDWAYVLADDDGRVLQVSGPPADQTDEEGRSQPMLMSGAGRRVLVLPIVPPDSGPILWESLDGGATWDRQTGPQSLAREYERGSPVIHCALGGCLIGETVTRVGWGGQGSDTGGGDRPPDTPPPGTQSVLAPIVCELAKTPWSRVDNAHGGLSYGVPIPGIHEAMRGRAVWSVLTLDRRTGAIASVSAMLPESGEGDARVITRQMLGPKPGGQHLATSLSPTQHEGFAAVRVAVTVDAKTGKPKLGAPMRNVEVAWENFLEGTSGRARIADAGSIEANDVSLGEVPSTRRRNDDGLLTDVLHASLISVTSRGVFVHPHQRAHGAPAFFIDAAGRVVRYEPYTFPSASPVSGALDLRTDASAVGGELLAVGLLREGDEWSSVALGRRNGTGTAATTTVTAFSLLPPRSGVPLAAYTSWAWSPKAPVGVSEVVADAAHAKAWAHFVGFRSDGTFGPAEPVPTLFDLGDRPRGCSAAERASTPRVNVPFTLEGRPLFPGARHPVIVREPKPKNAVAVDDSLVLLTSGAVLQGTPSAPCVAAWEAPAVGRNAAGAILPGDLAHAWLFRFSQDVPKSAGKRAEAADPVPTLEFRQMSCRYDPAARVPDAVWNEPGTSRP